MPLHFIVNLDLMLKHKISKFKKGVSDKNFPMGTDVFGLLAMRLRTAENILARLWDDSGN